MDEVFKRLDALRANPRHRFSEPASADVIKATRAALPTIPDDLAKLYAYANGFELYRDEMGSEITLLACSELHQFRDVLGPPDPSHAYSFVGLGDPHRLRVFETANGSYISFTALGYKTGRWIDDYREGVAGIVGSSLKSTLLYILDCDDGERIHVTAQWDMPGAYDAVLTKLQAQEDERVRSWFAAQKKDDADDWSDVADNVDSEAGDWSVLSED